MKKIFTLMLTLCSLNLWAYDLEVDGIYYNILADKTNEVEVTNGLTEYSGSVTIPETVTYSGIAYSVTSIGGSAFSYCSGLTSVTIGNSVTSIGDLAFYCCYDLTSITIPNSVTSIGRVAFGTCTGLTSVTIPNSVTSIGSEAFRSCYGLTSIIVEEGNSIYDSRENCNAIIETNSNTLVAGCQNTTIPNSVTSIGNYAFYNCSGLTSITIPNSVTSIGERAFYWCSGLKSITIPNTVTSIGDYAFARCSGLTSITIPESVTSIGISVFWDCSGLTSITIPNSITSIGESAFESCYGLTSVTIPNSVTSIGSGAFYNCSGLTSVTIGNSITSIGSAAFGSCSGLTSVTCEAVNLPEMEDEVFWDVSTSAATLYVPEESLEKYKTAAQWKEFGTILPISQVGTDLENIGLDNGYEVIDNGKLLRNGQLVIVRDGVEYNAQGQIVKE